MIPAVPKDCRGANVKRLLCVVSQASVLLCLVTLPQTLQADGRVVFGFDGPPGDNGVPAPWSFRRWSPTLGFGSFEAIAKVDKKDGTPVLCVKSVRSGFIVGTKRDMDASTLREVTWSWRAETLPKDGSFRERATNDQALQVLFTFDGGKVLSYVWDTTGPVGATGSGLAWENDVQVMVLEAGSAKLGQWVTERRNLHEDYRKLFGATPKQLQGVAVQSNSQHTDSSGAGCVGPITLTGK